MCPRIASDLHQDQLMIVRLKLAYARSSVRASYAPPRNEDYYPTGRRSTACQTNADFTISNLVIHQMQSNPEDQTSQYIPAINSAYQFPNA